MKRSLLNYRNLWMTPAALAALAISVSVAQAQQPTLVAPPIAAQNPAYGNYGGGGALFLPGYSPMNLYFGGNLPIVSNNSVDVAGVPGGSAQVAGNMFSPSGFFSPYGPYMGNDTSAANLNGGPVPTDPRNANGADPTTGQVNGTSQNAPVSTAHLSPVLVRRAANSRVDITYRGDTNNVSRITMMLLDSSRRELTRQVLTGPPAQARLLRLRGSKYYRVRLEYQNGTTRSYSGQL